MIPHELRQRLLSIQMRLESHDQHNEECTCNFCEAIYELSTLRSELHTLERLAKRAIT